MRKSQYINICFSDKDKELIAWSNMIREDCQSINTWVQAVLLADAVGEPLDVGGVYIPKTRGKTSSAGIMMLGDDRKSAKTKDKPASGWQVRGENGEIVAGSILSIRVTRPVMIALLENLHRSHKRIGPYAKAVLRKKIRKLDAGPNIPPDESQIQDIFALYEDRYITDTGRQVGWERQPSASCGEGGSDQNQEKGQKRDTNPPRRENQNCQLGQNSGSRQMTPPTLPQQKKPQMQPCEGKTTRVKNPLLGYIK